jgi:preprotein translocase subunit SecA
MDMMARIAAETVEKIFWVQIAREEDVERMEEEQQKQARKKMVFNLVDEDAASAEPAKAKKMAGRNEPCPCGSGKKYKKCCGK